MKQATSHSLVSNVLKKLCVLLVFPVLFFSCDPDTSTKKDSGTENLVPPVNVTELWKLELLYPDFDALRTAAGAGGGLTFQFAYDHGANPRLTLIAFAERSGRNFQPPTVRYLRKVDPAPANPFLVPNKFSLGDQYIKFNGANSLEQLLANVPRDVTFYSLTFTPAPHNTTVSPASASPVTNIKYIVCVKFINPNTGSMVEVCNAAPTELQPSPPAN